MAAGVVLDTSYLITLADSSRKNHETARRFWRHFTENGMPIFLSTIVVSEFCIKQQIPPAILSSCVVLPFNWDDALQAAKLGFKKEDREGESRVCAKDDLKIIAQANVKDAALIITDDTKFFYNTARRLAKDGAAKFRVVKLEHGFDSSVFDPTGQQQLGFVDDEPDANA